MARRSLARNLNHNLVDVVDTQNLFKFCDALRDGYRYEIIDNLVRIENPDYREPDGDPCLVIKVIELIDWLRLHEQQVIEEQELNEQRLDDLNLWETRATVADTQANKHKQKLREIAADIRCHLEV